MSNQRGVKTQRSALSGVMITHFVDDIPTGCSAPDFERKPITLTLQEGKIAIFRILVKGEPKPKLSWQRSSGKIDDPEKYQFSSISGTNGFALQVSNITANDAGVYRFTAVNEYGEATCSAGLKIIRVGFKKTAKDSSSLTPQKGDYKTKSVTDLKEEIKDFRKSLKKIKLTAPPKKKMDMEQVWQLLLHADRKDYEKICFKYGIVDFRGMLRKLQEMKEEKETKQSMDGELIKFGQNDENKKHSLRQVGNKYNFIINDLHPEDAGVYKVKVEDAEIFSSELEAENIPVYFRFPLGDVRCQEQGNAVLQCTLYESCFSAVWFHRNIRLEPNDKFEITVSDDGLTHCLVIKNAQPSDKGTFTIDVGRRTSSALLEVESANGKRKQIEGDSNDKVGWRKEQLEEDRSKKLRQGEAHEDQDHPTDSSMGTAGQYGRGQDGSLGEAGKKGQFSGPEADMASDSSRQIGLNGKDDMTGGAGTFKPSNAGGIDGVYDKSGMIGEASGLRGPEGLGSLYGKDSVSGGAGDTGGIGVYSKDGMLDGIGRLGGGSCKGGMQTGGGCAGIYDMDGMPGGTSTSRYGGVGEAGGLYGKGGMQGGTGRAEVPGGLGGPYDKDDIPIGSGTGGPGSSDGEDNLCGKDGVLGGSGVAGLYGKDGMPAGAGSGGSVDAGGTEHHYVKDGMLSGAGIAWLYGKDSLPMGAGSTEPSGDAGTHGLYAKQQMLNGSGKAGLHGKDGMSIRTGSGGPGDAGGIHGFYAKEEMLSGAGRTGVLDKDAVPIGPGSGGPTGSGGADSLYGKNGILSDVQVAELYGKDGMPIGAGSGIPGGAGGADGLYAKDGMLSGGQITGHYGKDGLCAKEGMLSGAGITAKGKRKQIEEDNNDNIGWCEKQLEEDHSKKLRQGDSLPIGAGSDESNGTGGTHDFYAKDGMLSGAGKTGFYDKDGIPIGAHNGEPTGAGKADGFYGKNGILSNIGIAGVYDKDGMSIGTGNGGPDGTDGLYAKNGMQSDAQLAGLYDKDGMPIGAGSGGALKAECLCAKDRKVSGAGVSMLYGKDRMPGRAGSGGLGGAGRANALYGKGGTRGGTDSADVPGGIGGHFDKDAIPVGSVTGGPSSSDGEDNLCRKDEVLGSAGVAGFYGEDGMPTGADRVGSGDAGGAECLYVKDGMLNSGLYGKNAIPLEIGPGGASSFGGIDGASGKDGMLARTGSADILGELYDKDGMPGAVGIGGHGGGGALGGAEGLVGLYNEDDMPGAVDIDRHGSPGGEESPYGKDSMLSSCAGCLRELYGKDGMVGSIKRSAGTQERGGLYDKDGVPTVPSAISRISDKNGIASGTGIDGAGDAGGKVGLYGKDGRLGAAAGASGLGGLDGFYDEYGMLGEVGSVGRVSGYYSKETRTVKVDAGGPDNVGNAGSLYVKDGRLGDADGPRALDGTDGHHGTEGVAGYYDKDRLPVGAGIDEPSNTARTYGLNAKDGILVKVGISAPGGSGEAGGLHQHHMLGGVGESDSVGGCVSLYCERGVLDSTSRPGGTGRAGSLHGKYHVLGSTSGLGGTGHFDEIQGNNGRIAAAGGPGKFSGPYEKDNILGGISDAGKIFELYSKNNILNEAESAGHNGSGGASGLYGKSGMLGGVDRPTGTGRLGGFYGMDGILGGADLCGLGGTGELVRFYGQDHMPLGMDAGGHCSAGGEGRHYGKDSMPSGAGPGGIGGLGRLYGKDGMPGGHSNEEGEGGLCGKDGIQGDTGGTGGRIAGFCGQDGMLISAGTGSFGDAGKEGGLYGKGGNLSSSDWPGSDGREVVPCGMYSMLDRAGSGGSNSAGGVAALYNSDGVLGGTGICGPARAQQPSGLYGKDGILPGSVVGVGGFCWKDRMPIDDGEEGDLYCKNGLASGEGRGSHSIGDQDELYGKDGRVDGIGVDATGLSQEEGLGNLFGKESRLGGIGVGIGTGGADGLLHEKMLGIPTEEFLAYGQSSGFYDAGSHPGNRRQKLSDLDASGLISADASRSRDGKGRGRIPFEEDMREPHCHFTQGLVDSYAQKGKPAVLSCNLDNDQIEGKWFKDGSKIKSLDGVYIEKEGPVHKLIIDEVQEKHAGKYKFEAEDIQTEASLFVEDPPCIDPAVLEKLKNESIVVKAGKSAMIKIPFEGQKPIRATWLKDDFELLDETRISTDYLDDYTRLTIYSTNRKDCGDYKVKLKNESGTTEATLKLIVIDKPQPPLGPIEVVDSSPSDISIQWKPPKDDGGKPIKKYIIERQQVGRKTWLTVGETNGNTTVFTTNKVEHGKSYYFRVRAVNAEGTSKPLESEEMMAATKVLPGRPAPPKIISTNKSAVTISWTAPQKTGNSRILGYRVERCKKGSNTWTPVTDMPITERKCTVTDLKEGLQYEFRVTAINAAGMSEASAPSEAVFAQDPMKPPGPVKDLKVVNSDYSSISLSWLKPESEEGSLAKGYIVERRHSDTLRWIQCNAIPITTTAYTVRGLNPREMYSFRVRAINDGGLGDAVELDTCVQAVPPIVGPKFLVKDNVKSFMNVKAGNAIHMRIPFEASPTPEVFWQKDGKALPPKAVTATREGLSELIILGADFSDSGHYAVVLQRETGGKETFSFLVNVSDVPEAPGPIQLVEKVPDTVTLIWEPSPTEKRDRNLNYMVMRQDTYKGSWELVADLIYTNKCTIANFIPGRKYFFRVLAKNYMGISEPSETVQPWIIHRERGKYEVTLPKYKGIDHRQPPRFLVPLKPHMVILGFYCHMSCAVTGYPAPQVTWYKDGKNLSKDPAFFSKNEFGICSLMIPGVTPADAGQYMVVAINELGEANSKAELTIKA